MAAIAIRRAMLADAEALSLCFRRAYAPCLASLSDLPPVANGLAEEIEARSVWVAEEKGRLLGGVILMLGENHGRLANLAVDPGASGKGVGCHLIATVEEACQALGLPDLRLTSHAAMEKTLRLYRHLGWQETGRSGNRVFTAKQVLPLHPAGAD